MFAPPDDALLHTMLWGERAAASGGRRSRAGAAELRDIVHEREGDGINLDSVDIKLWS